MSVESPQNDKALVVTREVGSHQFGQRASDGYFNATAMCKAAEKLFGNYYQLKSTKAFLVQLESVIGIPITAKTTDTLKVLEAETLISVSELVQRVRGGRPELQGTWVHPRVAIHLATWLSLEFETLVTGWVVDWFRQQGELQGALKEWISPDLQPWTLTFPPEFYGEIYRLKGWVGPIGPQKPSVIGHYTNDIVYARLTPGLLEMLRIKNPRQITGERRDKHHQWLTFQRGYPQLEKHLAGVVMLMSAFTDWDDFMAALDLSRPVLTSQLSLFESQKAELTLWD